MNNSNQKDHFRIVDYIMQKIMENEFVSGQRIPSLNQLSQLFEVNRNVTIQALTRLENLGWISPIQGKGYFVNKRPTKVMDVLSKFNRFTDTMTRTGEKPNSRLLDWTLAEPMLSEQEALNITSKDKVYRLEVLRFLGPSPITILTASFPEKIVPGMEKYLGNFYSLHGILMEHYGFNPTIRYSTIEAKMPTEQDAKWLEIPEDIPVFWKKSLNLHPNGTPVEMVVGRIRSDRYQITVDFENLEKDNLIKKLK